MSNPRIKLGHVNYSIMRDLNTNKTIIKNNNKNILSLSGHNNDNTLDIIDENTVLNIQSNNTGVTSHSTILLGITNGDNWSLSSGISGSVDNDYNFHVMKNNSEYFTILDNGNIGIGQNNPTKKLDINGDVNIAGQLNVNGTLNYLNTENTIIKDPLIKQASDNPGDSLDIGHYGIYNDGSTKFSGFFRDATDNTFKLFTGLEVEPTNVVDTSATGYTKADLDIGNLDVSGNINFTGTLFNNGVTFNSVTKIENTNNTTSITSEEQSDTLIMKTNSSERMRITSSGNVGIGTDVPSELLHIQKDQDGDTSLYIQNSNSSNNNYTSVKLRTDTTFGYLNQYGGSFSSSGALKANSTLLLGYGTNGLSLVAGNTGGDVRFYTNGTSDSNERMVVNSSGNVGIGITNPTSKLHIQADTNEQEDETGEHGLKISTGVSNQTLMMGYDGTDDLSYINSENSLQVTPLGLQTRGGNVGIGKINPSYTLDISGNVNFTGSIFQNGVTYFTSGDLVYIGERTASSSLDINFNDFSGNFSKYIIEIINCRPADVTHLLLRMSSNNGSSYDSGTTSYTSSMTYGMNPFYENSSSIRLTGNLNSTNNSNKFINLKIEIINPILSARTNIRWDGSYVTSNDLYYNMNGSGYNENATSINAIKIFCETGLIAEGNFKLYGVKATTLTVPNDDTEYILTDSNSLKFYTNSVQRALIDNNGNLGVGITNPSYPLDIVGDINTTTDYNISGTQVLSSTTLGSSVVNSSLQNLGTLTSATISGDLIVDTDTLYVDSTNDRVGVNNSSPSYPLDISGETKTNVLHIQESNTRYRIGQISYSGLITGSESNYIDSFTPPTLTTSTGDGTFTVSSSGNDAGTNPANVFDGNNTTYWDAPNYDGVSGNYTGGTNLTGSYAGEWIKLQTPKSLVVRQYEITTGPHTFQYYSSAPTTFKLFGSNDDSNWVELDSQSGVAGVIGNSWTYSTKKTFTVNASVGYTYFALVINAAHQFNYGVEIGTLNFIGSFEEIGTSTIDGFGIGITTNDTIFNISTDGNLGVGITNPSYKLDVQGDVNFNGTIYQNGTTFTPDVSLIKDTDNTTSITTEQESETLIFSTNNSEKMRIKNDGLVGIGITNPSYKLDVVGDINFTGILYQNGTTFSSGGGGYSSFIKDTDNTTSITTEEESETLIFNTNNSEKMRIQNNGLVGIGITNPNYKLDVSGDINFTGTFTNNGINAIPYVYLRDEKTAGTSGGTFTSGAWRTRTLNTEVEDTHNICTLSSNQFTLEAGTYRILARCPALRVNRMKAKLYNISDATDELIGDSSFTSSGDNIQTNSHIKGKFTIASSKTFEIQHRSQSSYSSHGFGLSSNFGVVEVYSEVELWKLY